MKLTLGLVRGTVSQSFLHWAKFSDVLSLGFSLAFELILNVKG